MMREGYEQRPASYGDLQAITDVIIATEILERGESNATTEELVSSWQRPRFNLDQDAWVVITKTDPQLVVGYEEVWNRKDFQNFMGDGYVHPAHRNVGIGTALIRRMESRVREQIQLASTDSRIVIQNGVSGADTAGISLHENEGYQPVRYFWRMEITLDQEPIPAEPISGIDIILFKPGLDGPHAYQAVTEAFHDHWNYIQPPYEEWSRYLQNESFNPKASYLAMAGAEPVGAVLCETQGSEGWVRTLAVRRNWRRMGVGLFLLRTAFSEFYRMGMAKAGLSVDAENLTGATRLYEKAGMHVAHQYIVFEKEIQSAIISTDC
ncbi:MAG TPA: GNAT family N-acetyltransferase [Anaerolineales bacterium]|nr:GNAT family N-acetyltransferase [Anaerolineales bacterium]